MLSYQVKLTDLNHFKRRFELQQLKQVRLLYRIVFVKENR